MYIITLQGKDSIYEQIRNQIIKFVELGVLKANDKLPSVRSLATDLGINPNTVQRAYAQLEKEGIIYTMNKKGAFVADSNSSSDSIKLSSTISSLKMEGISKEDLLKMVDAVYGGYNNDTNL